MELKVNNDVLGPYFEEKKKSTSLNLDVTECHVVIAFARDQARERMIVT